MAKLKSVTRENHQHGQVTHIFFCPGCQGAHGVSTDIWTVSGTPECPTIRASVLVRGHLGTDNTGADTYGVCHSFVTDGRIEYLSDCTHALAGQTVDLPDFDDWFK